MMGGHHAKFTPTLQCLTMTAAHFRPFRHCKAFYGFPTFPPDSVLMPKFRVSISRGSGIDDSHYSGSPPRFVVTLRVSATYERATALTESDPFSAGLLQTRNFSTSTILWIRQDALY